MTKKRVIIPVELELKLKQFFTSRGITILGFRNVMMNYGWKKKLPRIDIVFEINGTMLSTDCSLSRFVRFYKGNQQDLISLTEASKHINSAHSSNLVQCLNNLSDDCFKSFLKKLDALSAFAVKNIEFFLKHKYFTSRLWLKKGAPEELKTSVTDSFYVHSSIDKTHISEIEIYERYKRGDDLDYSILLHIYEKYKHFRKEESLLQPLKQQFIAKYRADRGTNIDIQKAFHVLPDKLLLSFFKEIDELTLNKYLYYYLLRCYRFRTIKYLYERGVELPPYVEYRSGEKVINFLKEHLTMQHDETIAWLLDI